MSKLVRRVSDGRIGHNIIETARTYLASSQSKEQLRSRASFFFRLAAPFFMKNSPRFKQNTNALAKLEFYKSHLSPGESGIDVGCYDGFYTQGLREHGCSIVGVDFLETIIKKARRFDPEGDYITAFAEELPFPDESMGFGIYSHVLHHVLSPEVVLAEARRVIRPGGKVIAVLPKKLGREPSHLKQYTLDELGGLVSHHFPNIAYSGDIGTSQGHVAYR